MLLLHPKKSQRSKLFQRSYYVIYGDIVEFVIKDPAI